MLPTHYANVLEERVASKVCGYPLCTNPLPPTPRGGRYRIDTVRGVVLDNTEIQVGRHCSRPPPPRPSHQPNVAQQYCGQACFAASVFFAAQLNDGTALGMVRPASKVFTLWDHHGPVAASAAATKVGAAPKKSGKKLSVLATEAAMEFKEHATVRPAEPPEALSDADKAIAHKKIEGYTLGSAALLPRLEAGQAAPGSVVERRTLEVCGSGLLLLLCLFWLRW